MGPAGPKPWFPETPAGPRSPLLTPEAA